MAITDLTGTTWNVKAGWNTNTIEVGYALRNITGFCSTDEENEFISLYLGMKVDGSGFSSAKNYIGFRNKDLTTYHITPSTSFTITITGGTDATTPALIAWLSQYGELQEVEAPTTAVIKAGTYRWNDDADIPPTSFEGEMVPIRFKASPFNLVGDTYNGIVTADEFGAMVYIRVEVGDINYTMLGYCKADESNVIIYLNGQAMLTTPAILPLLVFPPEYTARWSPYYVDIDNGSYVSLTDIVGEGAIGCGQTIEVLEDTEVPIEYGNWFTANTKPINKKFTRLYINETVASAGSKCFKRLTTDEPVEELGNYLTFSSPNSFTLATNRASKSWDGTLEYSTDATAWDEWDGTTISADDGVLYMRGTGNTKITSNANSWVLSGSNIACNGNIENLLDYATVANGEHPTMAMYCYLSMFYGCTGLTTAPKLPATTLAYGCYHSMFYGCTSLTTSPELPATTLAHGCYYQMFYGCASLTTPPKLLATTLAEQCCWEMFYGCTSLTTVPELPATTLTEYCYYQMFYGCASLTTPPKLPATTLARACYCGMFYGCTNLTSAPKLPATTMTISCYYNMFGGCMALTTVPELPATTLAQVCYGSMFYGCTNIKLSASKTSDYQTPYIIPTSGTGTIPNTATDALTNMFTNTGGTFTGTPSINTTYYTSNTVV